MATKPTPKVGDQVCVAEYVGTTVYEVAAVDGFMVDLTYRERGEVFGGGRVDASLLRPATQAQIDFHSPQAKTLDDIGAGIRRLQPFTEAGMAP
jgi:hypothetical protein